MLRLVAFVCGALGIAGVVMACGKSSVPTPTYVAHPTSALVEVPYPPPPARVERVPAQPEDGAVWIDGEWTWQGRRWAWRPGRWVIPPEKAKYAPWTTQRDESGTLYIASGAWRDDKGAQVDDPPPVKAGRPGSGGIVNPEGEEVAPAPITAADASPMAADQQFPEGGAPPSDASLVDLAISDAVARPDALPLEPPAP